MYTIKDIQKLYENGNLQSITEDGTLEEFGLEKEEKIYKKKRKTAGDEDDE